MAQAGAIAFRGDGASVRLLLVRSRRDPASWIFPKGHVEPGESPADAALREAHEEAGVTGQVVGYAGALSFEFETEIVEVDYYVVRVTSEGASPEGRAKIWLPPDEAIRRLAFDNAREVLRAALSQIEKAPRRWK